MSQAGGPSSGGGFGEARIDFTGNTAPLEAAAQRAVDVTKDAAAQAQAAADATKRTEEAWKGTATAQAEAGITALALFRQLNPVVTVLSATVSGCVAAVVGFKELIIYLGRAKVSAAEAANALGELGGETPKRKLSDLEEAVGRVQERFEKYRQSLWDIKGLSESDRISLEIQSRGKEKQAVEETTEAYKKAAKSKAAYFSPAAVAEAEAREKVNKEIEDTENRAKQARIEAAKELADEVEKLEIDRATMRDAMEKKVDHALDDRRKEAYRKEWAANEELFAARIMKAQDERDKRIAGERDASKRIADDFAKAMSTAISSVQQQSAALFTGDQVTAQLERVASLLEQIADQRSMIGGRD